MTTTTALVPQSVVGFVRSEAAAHDVELDDMGAGFVLWNYTGFPSFWPRGFGSPRDALRWQLHEYFEMSKLGFVPCQRCGERAHDWLCPRCMRVLATQLPRQMPAESVTVEIPMMSVEVTGEIL